MKTVMFSEVEIGQSFVNRDIDGRSTEYRKLGPYCATCDEIWEDRFVLHEPVEIVVE